MRIYFQLYHQLTDTVRMQSHFFSDQQKAETLHFANQLLLIDSLLPNFKSISAPTLPSLVQIDTISLKTSQQIQLETKQDRKNSQRSRILYDRANKLERFIRKGKSLMEMAFQELIAYQEVSLQLSSIRDKTSPDRQIQIKVKKQTASAKQDHIVIRKTVERNRQNDLVRLAQEHPYEELITNDENFNTSNRIAVDRHQNERKKPKTVKLNINKDIRELKRPEYHIRYDDSTQSQIPRIMKLEKKRLDLSPAYQRQLTPIYSNYNGLYRNNKRSTTPKTQRAKSLSPLKSSIPKQKSIRKIEKRPQKESVEQKHVQPGNHQLNLQNYLLNNCPHRSKQETSIYIQTENLSGDDQNEERRSLQLLNKIADKTDKSFSDLGREITGIKDAISELGESRLSERFKAKEARQDKPKIKSSFDRAVATPNQPVSSPHTVEEEQMWECEEDELEQEIKKINQKLSRKDLQSANDYRQRERSSQPVQPFNQVEIRKKTRNSLLVQQGNHKLEAVYDESRAKHVKLNLTPDKIPATPKQQKSLNIQIDVSRMDGVLNLHKQKSRNADLQFNGSAKEYLHTEYKKVDHHNESGTNYSQCGKWKKQKKKQLLSMKIASLRD